jgi:hypothetical protein
MDIFTMTCTPQCLCSSLTHLTVPVIPHQICQLVHQILHIQCIQSLYSYTNKSLKKCFFFSNTFVLNKKITNLVIEDIINWLSMLLPYNTVTAYAQPKLVHIQARPNTTFTRPIRGRPYTGLRIGRLVLFCTAS